MAGIACGIVTASAATINLPGANPTKVDAGFFPEGTMLSLSATGTMVLCWEYLCRPDGSLAAPISMADTARLHALPGSESYPTAFGGDGTNYFAGGGLNYVPGHGDISWPVAGKRTTDTKDPAAIRFGAVVGTFADSPTREDWFCIGSDRTVTVPQGGAHLYLLVNDSSYGDNSGGYWVTIEKNQPQSVAASASPAAAPTSPAYSASSPVAPLPRDAAFGYALPAGIGLTHQIEASPDLVHWAPPTNVIFYFKDLDSPNFSSRFYRFQEPK